MNEDRPPNRLPTHRPVTIDDVIGPTLSRGDRRVKAAIARNQEAAAIDARNRFMLGVVLRRMDRIARQRR
jgi:hypothetical protein